MKQIFQNLKSGVAEALELPTPKCMPGTVLVQTEVSLISPGTERMLADFGRAGWISKARQQPDKVKQVLQKMRTDGVEATVQAVFSKLDQPLPVGYSNVGTVVEVGEGVTRFRVGDRVVSNGYHAELVVVPENLCASIPEGVSGVEAAFTVLGAIALQGVRLAEPTLGETFCVSGLGLIGLLTAQILQANGCRVIGLDVSAERVQMAESFGITALHVEGSEDPTERVLAANSGFEVDGVLITANTSSNGPITTAPRMTRKRGRIVLVGVVGLTLDRTAFFQKEITFQVSCSYGPGRYDEGYEKKGLDYPRGYVRWTEQRNFQAVLELLRSQRLSVQELLTEEIAFGRAEEAYDRILSDGTGYGFLFRYRENVSLQEPRVEVKRDLSLLPQQHREVGDKIGFIGAGGYARAKLLPAFRAAGASFSGIVSRTGQGSADLARKFHFAFHATEPTEVFRDPTTRAVVIATRHDSHAALVQQALLAGKDVFVEKPLALNREELLELRDVAGKHSDQALIVGFNRRFSPLALQMKQLISDRAEPVSFQMMINAGAIPHDHWTQNAAEGGGRVVGELCHFVDFAHFLVDAPVSQVEAVACGEGGMSDTVSVVLRFKDGSVGSLNYFANGHKAIPKERIELFTGGKVLQLENFRVLTGHGFPNFRKMRLWKQDKGQQKQAEAVLAVFRREKEFRETSFGDPFQSMETTFAVAEALSRHQ
ncbi:bi-domain-containing oxidoreductase [bacterium]|nr:bi-domain-containing oxidoreductase [bacterium]